jgi:hypothetical protein
MAVAVASRSQDANRCPYGSPNGVFLAFKKVCLSLTAGYAAL